jgi:hypothetical protein
MMVPGDQWPAFLYAGLDYDPEDPWKGLFKNQILVSVSRLFSFIPAIALTVATHPGIQARLHVPKLR